VVGSRSQMAIIMSTASNLAKCYSCKVTLTSENIVHNKGKSVGRESCCKQCNTKRVSLWYQNNKDKKRIYDAKRRKEKRYLYREASRKHRLNNPAKKKADVIARKSGISTQTPSWANFKYMNLFYKLAKIEQVRTGKAVHVDHIIPIISDVVCGLHCEDNMQLLFAEYNLKKSNHYSLEHESVK
jgi:hypothetical protein